MSHRHEGRTVHFRDKTGTMVSGRVIAVSNRYGSMELDMGGKRAWIRYPFPDPASTYFVPEND